jgi:hypothetical protein
VAISFRTIQDIRRVGEERASSRAGTEVESILDVAINPVVLKDIMNMCQEDWEDGFEECTFNKNQLEHSDFMGTDTLDHCKEAGLSIKREPGIEDVLVEKDDAFEVDLSTVNNGQMCITWEGLEGSDPDYMTIKIYNKPEDCDSEYNCVDSARAFTETNPDGWSDSVGIVDFSIADGGDNCISFSANAELARIKPIGADAKITLSGMPGGIPAHTAVAKAHCYTQGADGEDIYREFVRRFRINPTLPACFDYVLFVGDGEVNKYLYDI